MLGLIIELTNAPRIFLLLSLLVSVKAAIEDMRPPPHLFGSNGKYTGLVTALVFLGMIFLIIIYAAIDYYYKEQRISQSKKQLDDEEDEDEEEKKGPASKDSQRRDLNDRKVE
ncbi:unnamed protein product [Moneuplotes crassus]|uniref:Uncharacterized protein n=1 Tax=Euplotes crassus TaxID=5936 RepID=A0AAD1Y5G9_EUPCR|nr:unnamed protein product [Moneuplotes crassus]